MKARCLGGMLCMLVLATSAWADTINQLGGAGGSFQTFPGSLNQGNPAGVYWDNLSQDGNQRHIGYYLTGQTAYANSPNLANPQWLGSNNVAASFSILFNSTGPNLVTLLLKATANGLEFGYYNAANPSEVRPLLTTNNALLTQVIFTSEFPVYGLYIHYLPGQGPSVPSDYFRSVPASSTGSEVQILGPVHQHFSVFASGGTGNYIVGAEDGWGVTQPFGSLSIDEKQGDYQDFVVSIQAVPEPATFVLMGLGLGAALLARRLRK